MVPIIFLGATTIFIKERVKLDVAFRYHMKGRLDGKPDRKRGIVMTAQAQILDFNSPNDISPGAALQGVWQDFANSIAAMEGDSGYGNKDEMSSVLNHNAVLMHKLLMSSAIYRNIVNSNFSRLIRTKHWGWKSIYEDELGRVGLFSVYRNAPVPMHDHPGTHGVLMVIEGEVEVERYTLQEQYRNRNESGIVELDFCERKMLKPFEITWFQEKEGNIHGLKSLSDQCVMLKMQLPCEANDNRSWYFPAFSIDGVQKAIPARRIMSRYL